MAKRVASKTNRQSSKSRGVVEMSNNSKVGVALGSAIFSVILLAVLVGSAITSEHLILRILSFGCAFVLMASLITAAALGETRK